MKRLEARTAIVTGAARGIGRAIALRLAAEGARVAVNYRTSEMEAKQVVEEIVAGGGEALLIQANVCDAAESRGVVRRVVDQWGRLDILVNNAGITVDKTVVKMTDEDWFKVLNVNLSGAFFLSQAALKHMAERGSGRIVNVSSVIGEMGNIGQANYASSKSGLFGLTKTLAREAAFLLAKSGKLNDPDNIGLTVNTVTPGFIATEMLEHIPEKVLEKIVAQIPLARLGKPEEVARVVHFLAADASSYITGQVWGVNGGLDM
jgi:acetoacetyl-CoA reductase/3-oxoacyl-[acyl-carrier protein] reductase